MGQQAYVCFLSNLHVISERENRLNHSFFSSAYGWLRFSPFWIGGHCISTIRVVKKPTTFELTTVFFKERNDHNEVVTSSSQFAAPLAAFLSTIGKNIRRQTSDFVSGDDRRDVLSPFVTIASASTTAPAESG